MRISLTAFALAGCAANLAPTPPRAPPADAQDAVVAAPGSHRVLLENDRVRVLEVSIAPGAREPPHTHRWPSVMIIDQPAPLLYYDASGALRFDGRDRPPQAPPITQSMPPEALHAVENAGTTPFHAIRVELKAAPPPVHALRVDRPGATLAVRVAGNPGAPALIAIGGGPGYSHDYMEALEALTAGPPPVRVVTYDARGTGGSTVAADATFRLEDTVADLDAVRAAVGADQAVFLGHSYGALVAEAYAIAHPERVRGLVLIDAMPDRKRDLRRAIDAAQARARALRAEGLYEEAPEPAGDDCRAAMNRELVLDFADPRHPAARSLGATTCSASTGARTFQALGDYDLSGALAAVRVPVLLAFGDRDPNAFELDLLAAQLRDAAPQIATFAACGHYPFLECPPPFFDRVRSFLRGL
jgi:pimeloyl-ACP methyl ester carboxylesterase